MIHKNGTLNVFGDAISQEDDSALAGRIGALRKILTHVLKRHKHLSGYFEAMLREMDSEPNTVLFLKLARWLKNQPKHFREELDLMYSDGNLADDFGAALAKWAQDMMLEIAMRKSRIRRAYATQLFPSLGSVAVGISVIHQESHHANHVDMVYVCGMAGAAGAKRIFEFGTYRGQTTCGLASVCSDAQVYTLNLPPEADPRYAPFIGMYIGKSPDRDRITQIFCDSTTFDTMPYRGAMDYIFIDGDHSYEGVKNDTEKALELLKPGGVIVWHDYAAKSPGVLDYLAEFSQQRPLFLVRNTCLAVYLDGVDATAVTLPPMDASLEIQEYSAGLAD